MVITTFTTIILLLLLLLLLPQPPLTLGLEGSVTDDIGKRVGTIGVGDDIQIPQYVDGGIIAIIGLVGEVASIGEGAFDPVVQGGGGGGGEEEGGGGG